MQREVDVDIEGRLLHPVVLMIGRSHLQSVIKINKLYSPNSRISSIKYQDAKRIHLSKDEVNLLTRGHSFCPTPQRAYKEVILDNLES